MKTITIKLTKANSRTGPFTIKDQQGNVIVNNVEKNILVKGISYNVADNVSIITISSIGKCSPTKTQKLTTIKPVQLANTIFTQSGGACLWRHLVFNKFNEYYGVIEPYTIEYPFSANYNDEILQSVQDYTKVYKYIPESTGVFSYTNKVMIDDGYFNESIIYNGQQCTGVLTLVPKPLNNLKSYGMYPIYNTDSKTITYTKSDSFIQYNTFWDCVKNKNIPIAITSCESLSCDGVINQSNMDYSQRSFNKAPIRAKDLKIRHSLTDRSDIHLVSQFIIAPSQISYK